MKTMIALLLLAAPLAASFDSGSALAQDRQDVIRFKDRTKNPDLEGDVVTLNCKAVEIEVLVDGARIKRTVDPKDIADLVPRKSIDFAKAEEALANGNFDAAVQRFERVAADPRAGELLNQLAGIQIVRTRAASGAPVPVINAARAVQARKKDGYYVGESYRLAVKALLESRDPKLAQNEVKAFLALANALVALDWIRDADLLDAQVMEAQGNHRGALPVYRKHAKDSDVADECALGEMRCFTALNDWVSLRRRSDAVIKESLTKKTADTRPLIAAFTGRGDLDMNDGKAKEALLNYLQGAIVLNRGEKSAEHERALARSSITCARLATAEKTREAKDLQRGRAQELSRELTALYPQTRFKNEVDKAIGDIPH
jgi:hypothetical protein